MCASVAHHQVPAAVGRQHLVLGALIARHLVKPGDDEIRLKEPVAGACRLELVVGQNLERQVEASVEFVLPLLDQASRANDETSLQIASDDEFLDQQPRHNRLAGARIVGEQEAQRLPRQHRLINRRNLVRQRFDERRVDS